MREIKIKSYAKINLFLDCLYLRPDGYHQLESVMQIISLYDRITIKSDQGIKIHTNHPQVPTDQRNLAFQAAHMLLEKFPKLQGVEIGIEKKIPLEAGLGGGSSNAASVLWGMKRLFDLSLSTPEIMEMAAEIGSDVPFFLMGPTALAYGRGEKLTKLNDCPRFWQVLIKPSQGVKTAEVYRSLDLRNKKVSPSIQDYLEALKEKDLKYLLEGFYNILEESTFRLYPEVFALRENIRSLGAKNVLISGSGPTILTAFATEKEAQAFAQKVKNLLVDCSYQLFITHTLNNQEYKERIEEHALQ